MNTYTLNHQCSCPLGGLEDYYTIKISSQRIVLVEQILKVLKNAPAKIFQEDLADYLRCALGAEIEITGYHHGIKITCTRL